MRTATVILALIVLASVASSFAAPQDSEGGIKCALCQELVTMVEGQLQKNSTEAAVDQALLKVCSQLHVTPFCNSTILPVLNSVYEDLVTHEPPEHVCQLVKACDAATASMKRTNLGCAVCQATIAFIKNIVGPNANTTSVSTALASACDKVPGAKLSTICQSVSTFVTAITTGIDKKKSNSAICIDIKLCTSY